MKSSRRTFLGLCAACVGGACASSRSFSGNLELGRLERGEIFLQHVRLSAERRMLHAAAIIDAPIERAWNLLYDVDGYPLWHSGIESLRVLARAPELVDAEVTFKPILGQRLSASVQRIRFDEEKRETAITMQETDWARQIVNLIKLDAYGDGKRTLFNGYFNAELKGLLAHIPQRQEERNFLELIENARQAVKLDRYATRVSVVTEPAVLPRVLVPIFHAPPLGEDLRHTLTRVFAQHLMKSSRFNVVTEDEVMALLHHAQQRELMGCDGSAGCSADVARALAADRIVHGSIGRVGQTFVVTAALMNVVDASTQKRAEREAPGEDALLQAVRDVAVELGAA